MSTPKSYSVEELAALVNEHGKTVHLYRGAQWMEWEATAFLTGEPQVVKVNLDEDWPLQISFTGSLDDAQPVPFDPKMEFKCS